MQFLVHLLTGDRVRLMPGRQRLRFARNGAAFLIGEQGRDQRWVHPLLPHSLHKDDHGHYWRFHKQTEQVSKTVRRGNATTTYPEVPVRMGQVTAVKVYVLEPCLEGCRLWFEMCYVQHVLEHGSDFGKSAQWLPSRFKEWRRVLGGFGLGPAHLQQPWQPRNAASLPPESVLLRLPKRSLSSSALVLLLVRFCLHSRDRRLMESAGALLLGLLRAFGMSSMSLSTSRGAAGDATPEMESVVCLNSGQLQVGGVAWRSVNSPWRQFQAACRSQGWQEGVQLGLVDVLRETSRIRRFGRPLLLMFAQLITASLEAGFSQRRGRDNPVAANALLPKHSVEDQAVFDLAARRLGKKKVRGKKKARVSIP